MKHTFPRWIARLLVLVLVSAQLTVAAYACPELQAGNVVALAQAGEMAQAEHEQTPPTTQAQATGGCHDMAVMLDPESPTLCAEHCKAGQQSERVPVLAIAAAAQGGWYLRPVLAEPSPARRATASRAHALVLSAPPHAIEHCVRRT